MKYLKSYFCQEYTRGERWVWKGCIICKVKPESITFCIEAWGALGPSQSSPENKYQALIQQGLVWQSQGWVWAGPKHCPATPWDIPWEVEGKAVYW